MTGVIAAGGILMRAGTYLPASLRRDGTQFRGWSLMEAASPMFQTEVLAAGLTFFFMAGTIAAIAIGFDRRKTAAAALNRLIRIVAAGKCNSIEIADVTHHSFLKVPFVRITAHARHLQLGPYFGPAPAL